MLTVTRMDIVNCARSYIGTRWRQFGRTRAGVDCIGLVAAVLNDLKIPFEDRLDYQRRIPEAEVFFTEIVRQSDDGDMGNLRNGTLLMLRQPVYPVHCAWVAMDGKEPTIIHGSLEFRQVIEEPLAPKFIDKIVRVREIRGIVG